ncbi:hypothetical protein PSHT_00901 [Puccinia striiformis]|uniref:Major facilitator superfamily (MFS) profile domain-containing protein n=1 Tax=Puccinia striiformis TaxID=27350 RepID=A0A2S4WM10_9BASI|nr:hypothetical protein PSHT_00901 [Puccinia striiformis]
MPAVAGPVSFAPPEGKSSKMAIIIAGFAAFGGFLYGYDTGYIAGVKAMPFWLRSAGQLGSDGKYSITTSQDSLVTSILSVGVDFCRCPFSLSHRRQVWKEDRYNDRVRDILRWGCLANCIIHHTIICRRESIRRAGSRCCILPCADVSIGMCTKMDPRGCRCMLSMGHHHWIASRISVSFRPTLTWGAGAANMLDFSNIVPPRTVNATKDFDSANSYRIPIGIQFVWAAILVIGLTVLPESPRYLLLKGNEEEAWKSLSRLYSAPYDDPDVQAEFSEIMASLEKERSFGKTSLLDCFKTDKRKNLQRTLTGLGVQGWQQASGINFFFYYGTTFFKNSGIENAFLVTVATNVVNVVATIPGIWAVDKVGRRTMLIAGAMMMFGCELIVACVGTFTTADNQASQKVLVAFSCIFIGVFAATWGPIPWVVTSEIYPLATRGKQMAMSTASNWVVNFFIGFITPYLVDGGAGKAGLGVKVFWLWAALCFAALTFSFFLIPETKGLSLEQVDLLYTNSTVLKSNSYRLQLIANNLHEGMTPAEKAYQEKLEHI